MDDVVSTFPLLRLPRKAILKTLRIMTYPQRFGISFLSKKTKDLVESLKLTTRMFRVEVQNSLVITLYPQSYGGVRFVLNERLVELKTLGRNVRSEYPRMTWTNSMSVKQFLDHLKLMCHSSITTLQFSANAETICIESIHKNVKDFENVSLVSENHEHNKKVMSVLKPTSITLSSLALVNGCVPSDILIQNFDTIDVPSVRITLDDFLMTNSRVIDLGCNISVKTLNRFLKLWVKGSNLRLEWLHLQFHGDFENEELLRELDYKYPSPNRVRIFKSAGLKALKQVTGGWDIWRLDGTQATISFWRKRDSVNFQLFVWHDHCLVSEINF